MNSDNKVECRTPTPGKLPTRIERWKIDGVHRAILAVLPPDGEGIAFSDLTVLVEATLTTLERAEMGSIFWYTTTVKLEMEVRGEIRRAPQASPQNWCARRLGKIFPTMQPRCIRSTFSIGSIFSPAREPVPCLLTLTAKMERISRKDHTR